jgi:outer membrane protein assembly factor BamB
MLLPRLALLSLLSSSLLFAADQPQWGQAWTRNLISAEKGLPDGFDPETKTNVKWVVDLGTQAHSTPIIAGGRIFVGTNNANPRDPKHVGDRGVFMCLDEKDGHLLWQLVVPKLEDDKYLDWPEMGMCSEATVEGDRVYLTTNRGEVVCLDVHGMANGNEGYQDEGKHMTPRDAAPMTSGPLDADIIWLLDMKEACGIWCHDGAHSSIMIQGEHLYVNTGTGVDNTHRFIRRPEAPSLIVVEKSTGKYLARDDEHISPNIFHSTWSSPSFAEIDGKPTVFFCGGNGITYAFEPLDQPSPSGELLKLTKRWQYDMDPTAPKTQVHRFTQNKQESPSNIYGMPVIADGKLFVAGGGDVFWGKNQSWLKCVDPRDAKELWSYEMGKHTLTTPAIHEGLVYATDSDGTVHCVDAKTGTMVWTHPMNGAFWASAMVADGKIYLGTRKGNWAVLAAGREKKVLCNLELKAPISATATIANGVVYVTTMKQLWALSLR